MLLSSCTDADDQPDLLSDGALRIEANLKGYSGGSRTLDVDYTTSFSVGDDMGIFGIRNGQVMEGVCNVRAVYNGSHWTTEAPIKNYSDVQYFAYSPYKSDLQTADVMNIDDIIPQLSVPAQGTSDIDEYKANDWLVAGSGVVKEDVLKFTFTHAFSMLEIVLPRTTYKMTAKDGSGTLPNYYIPDAELTSFSEAGFQMCEASLNAYRCLVPDDTEVSVAGGYTAADGKIHKFSYTLPANTLKAGQCHSVVVDRQDEIDFSYENGDFFLSDGTLVSRTDGLTEEQRKQCLGVIFYINGQNVTMGSAEKEMLNEMGVGEHGYVVALRDVYNPSTGLAIGDKMWGPLIDVEGLENGEGMESYFADFSGLDKTQKMDAAALATGDYTKYVSYGISLFNQTLSTPSHTTGWFLPSIGQWIHMLEQLGEETISISDFSQHSWSTTGLSFEYKYKNLGQTVINNKLSAAGTTYDAISGNYWSSVEAEAAYALFVYFGYNAFDIYECHKGDSSKRIRCFFAF
jgi:hypothetical protein